MPEGLHYFWKLLHDLHIFDETILNKSSFG